MKWKLALMAALTITGCSTASPPSSSEPPDPSETGKRYITMDVDAVETARAALEQRAPQGQLEVIEAKNGVALVSYDAQDFRALSELMHERHGRCDGFVAHETLDDALGAFRAKDRERLAPLVGYTLDNAATVNGLCPRLPSPPRSARHRPRSFTPPRTSPAARPSARPVPRSPRVRDPRRAS